MTLALLAALAALIVVSIQASSDDKIVLNYAEVNSLDGTVPGEMAKAFKQRLEELSGGEITVNLHAGGVLGSEDQVLDNMLGGGNMTDLARVSALALTQYGCKKAALLALPFTFNSEMDFQAFCESPYAEEFLREPLEVGLPILGLCYAEEGFRNFFFTKPVENIEQIRNKKIRVSSDPIMISMIHDLGGIPTNLAFTELYSSLSTGIVDGAEQPVANYLSNAFYEVAPYLLLDGHTMGAIQIVISEYRWNHLNDQQREWVSQAARDAAKTAMDLSSDIVAQALETLKEKGVTIYLVEDVIPWLSAVQGTVDKRLGDLNDLYNKLINIRFTGEAPAP